MAGHERFGGQWREHHRSAGGLAEQGAELGGTGTRSGTAAAAALDGFATGEALRAALGRWQARSEALEQALTDAQAALETGRSAAD
ncbi:hypothetical protein [Kitasatospora sp. NPDC047058]|uniref:hypothetical protein n=1 Tax=Kitasatospora sp. NPDC047058 TaxID=3155620 RepID=UPI0033D5F69F